jgi:hypothetical protein
MKHELTFETEMENKIGRICGAVFEAICSTLTEQQENAARDVLRQAVASPKVYAEDKRLFASIAGYTDEELDQLMIDLYGKAPRASKSLPAAQLRTYAIDSSSSIELCSLASSDPEDGNAIPNLPTHEEIVKFITEKVRAISCECHDRHPLP